MQRPIKTPLNHTKKKILLYAKNRARTVIDRSVPCFSHDFIEAIFFHPLRSFFPQKN
jgi:hypothetical protein